MQTSRPIGKAGKDDLIKKFLLFYYYLFFLFFFFSFLLLLSSIESSLQDDRKDEQRDFIITEDFNMSFLMKVAIHGPFLSSLFSI